MAFYMFCQPHEAHSSFRALFTTDPCDPIKTHLKCALIHRPTLSSPVTLLSTAVPVCVYPSSPFLQHHGLLTSGQNSEAHPESSMATASFLMVMAFRHSGVSLPKQIVLHHDRGSLTRTFLTSVKTLFPSLKPAARYCLTYISGAFPVHDHNYP
jgi:hypothetical protein